MKNNSTTEIAITVTHGECNGFMMSSWYSNNLLLTEVFPSSANDITLIYTLKMPFAITINLHGKDPLRDTVIDGDGKIVKDKFVKVKSMSLARRPISEHIVDRLCCITTDDGAKFSTSYFGFNGQVSIKFNENDPILWHLKHNHYKVS